MMGCCMTSRWLPVTVICLPPLSTVTTTPQNYRNNSSRRTIAAFNNDHDKDVQTTQRQCTPRFRPSLILFCSVLVPVPFLGVTVISWFPNYSHLFSWFITTFILPFLHIITIWQVYSASCLLGNRKLRKFLSYWWRYSTKLTKHDLISWPTFALLSPAFCLEAVTGHNSLQQLLQQSRGMKTATHTHCRRACATVCPTKNALKLFIRSSKTSSSAIAERPRCSAILDEK